MAWDLPKIIQERYESELRSAEIALHRNGGRGIWRLRPPQPPLARLVPIGALQDYRNGTVQMAMLELFIENGTVSGWPASPRDREIIAGWATSMLGDLLDEHRRDIKAFVSVLDKEGTQGDA